MAEEIKKLSTYEQKPYQNGYIGNIFKGKSIKDVSFDGIRINFTAEDSYFTYVLDPRDKYSFWWNGSGQAIATVEIHEIVPLKIGYFVMKDAGGTVVAVLYYAMDANLSIARYTEPATGTFGNVDYL